MPVLGVFDAGGYYGRGFLGTGGTCGTSGTGKTNGTGETSETGETDTTGVIEKNKRGHPLKTASCFHHTSLSSTSGTCFCEGCRIIYIMTRLFIQHSKSR